MREPSAEPSADPAVDLARAYAPAPLADVGGPLLAIHRLLRREDLPAEARVHLLLRRAELLRRVLPDDALAVLDGLGPVAAPPPVPLDPNLVRVHALLEAGRLPEARALLPFVPAQGGALALVQARLAAQEGELDEAVEQCDACLAQVADPEVEAEALALRARLCTSLRRDATPDLDRLDALLLAHHAAISRVLVGFLRLGATPELMPMVSQGLVTGGLARLKAAYTFGFQQDAAKVAPIPLEVHAAAVRHRDEPERYGKAIIAFAALTWRAGDHLRAYAIATLGHQIGVRVHGAEAMAMLGEFLVGFEAEIPPEELGRLRAALHEAARRKMEPPPSPPEA